MTRRPHLVAALAAAVALAVAACSSGSGPGSASSATDPTTPPSSTAPSSSTAPPASTSSGPTSTTTAPSASTTAPAACPPAGSGPPPGSSTRTVADVDGDGRPDTAWFAPPGDSTRVFGITTASGDSRSLDVPLAGPVPLHSLVADADRTGPTEILVSDGRTALLYGFGDCTLAPITNPQGQTYAFDLGFRGTGTGVGCTDADHDGRRELVGLLRKAGGGDTVGWSRTIIELDGFHARNGPTDTGTFHEPADHDAIALLSTISCGDQRISDALQEPRA